MKGTIFRSTGSWYVVKSEGEEFYSCRLRGKFKIKGFKVTNPLAVGDEVEFYLEDEANEIGLITKILPRSNYLIRKSVHKTAHGHLIATNLDQAMVLATVVYPRTSFGFIDRFLVSAEAFRIPALVIFNKIDLFDEELAKYQQELIEIYQSIGYECLAISVLEGDGMDILNAKLKNKRTLVAGHSGVGKSSLINALVPDLDIRTAEISDYANKGVHTTTFAEMHEIEQDTYLIDTPGINELGLMDINTQELSHYFPEIRAMLGTCKFHNCTHTHEPKCEVLEAVKRSEIPLSRYESYLSMIDSYDNRR